jgi:predicted RNase H-like HicB family nuclease
MHTYIFRVELIQEEDGRWSAGVPALPGCATWGYTKEEALQNIKDGAEAYIRAMQKAGEEIPKDATTEVINEPVVAVTL